MSAQKRSGAALKAYSASVKRMEKVRDCGTSHKPSTNGYITRILHETSSRNESILYKSFGK